MRRLKISQFTYLKHSGYLGAADMTPAPFPGKWPTRIAWGFRGISKSGKWFSASYIGKPTSQTVSEFVSYQQQPKTEAWFFEFDRKHIPIYTWDRVQGVWTNPIMFAVYHFWQSWGNFGEHFLVPTYRRQLGGLWVYSPYRALARERKESWRTFMAGNTTYKPIFSYREAMDSL